MVEDINDGEEDNDEEYFAPGGEGDQNVAWVNAAVDKMKAKLDKGKRMKKQAVEATQKTTQNPFAGFLNQQMSLRQAPKTAAEIEAISARLAKDAAPKEPSFAAVTAGTAQVQFSVGTKTGAAGSASTNNTTRANLKDNNVGMAQTSPAFTFGAPVGAAAAVQTPNPPPANPAIDGSS